MTSKKSSHNLFYQMFRQSLFKASVLPLIGLAIGLFYLISELFLILDPVYASSLKDITGFFFDEIRQDDSLLNILLIFGAFITAALLFGFNWSKKQTNVIYSLGMTRKQIYLSRMLAGLLPVLAVIIILTVAETFNNGWAGFTPNLHYWKVVLYLDISVFSVYALAFILCSVVFANVGNFIEGSIFSLIFAFIPTVLNIFFNESSVLYTLGTPLEGLFLSEKWNWSKVFFMSRLSEYFDFSGFFRLDNINAYFSVDSKIDYSFLDYSSSFTALVLAVILFVIGLKAFEKHRNEIAGTCGRANGITEAAAVVSGFYLFTLVMVLQSNIVSIANGNLLTFAICMVGFLAALIIFRLIFSSKRINALKKSMKLFPIYTAGLGVMTLIFAFGLFGYSSYVPEASQVKHITISTEVMPYRNVGISGTSYFGFKNPQSYDYNNMNFFTSKISCTDIEEINEIIKLHGTIINDGKIKDSADDACLSPIQITYNLKNGKEVTRNYYESDIETAQLMMKLGDMKSAKDNLKNSIEGSNFIFEDMIKKSMREVLDMDVTLMPGFTDDNLGFLADELYNTKDVVDIWTVYDNQVVCGLIYMDAINNVYYVTEDSQRFLCTYDYYMNYDASTSFKYLYDYNCYLFSEDMKNGYCIGVANEELLNALKADMINQSVSQHYMHKPEDEIGILSFSLSQSYFDTGITVYDGYTEVYESYDGKYDTSECENQPGSIATGTSWNINSSDNLAIVITKDMKNTIKYFESHGLMKHLTAKYKLEDIKSIKTATISELNGKKSNSSNVPIFFGAYWSAATVERMTESLEEDNNSTGNYHKFEKIKNTITDKDKISKLLDNSVVLSFLDNDSIIVQIEYNDGALATVLVSAETYNKIG